MFWKKRRIYADAAAATPLSGRAKDELVRLLHVYGNAGALHREGVEARRELERARAAIAKAIGAHADEIVFTSGGTEANNLALHGFEKVVTSEIEHASVLEVVPRAQKISVDREGLVDLEVFANTNTDLVSVQLVNSEIGTIEPVREISKVLKKNSKKVLLHTDASQAPLWINIQVDKLGVDLMTLDAQKILGPKGVGCLYIRRGITLKPLMRGGKQEKGLRGGTENVPLVGAFAVALEEAQKGVEVRAQYVAEVRDFLWKEIKQLLPDAVLNGPKSENRVANNLNISIPGLKAEMAVIALDALGIAISTRSACDVGQEEPSHVIRAIGVSPDLAGTALRISLLPDVTQQDATRIAKTLQIIAKRYRNVV